MNGMAEVEGGIWTMTDTEFKRELAEAKAEALEEAATAWQAHQAAHMGKGTVQPVIKWLNARAVDERWTR